MLYTNQNSEGNGMFLLLYKCHYTLFFWDKFSLLRIWSNLKVKYSLYIKDLVSKLFSFVYAKNVNSNYQ